VGWGDQLELFFFFLAYLLLLCFYDIVKLMSLYVIVIVDFTKWKLFFLKYMPVDSLFAIQGRKKANSVLVAIFNCCFTVYSVHMVGDLSVH
jgi:hypothetical protein